jgi:hypothetical protein
MSAHGATEPQAIQASLQACSPEKTALETGRWVRSQTHRREVQACVRAADRRDKLTSSSSVRTLLQGPEHAIHDEYAAQGAFPAVPGREGRACDS